MLRIMLKSKIHGAIVTDANLEYEGSITIDKALLEKVDILPGERVQILNLHNGLRIETYVIAGKRGSGIICMNGPAARWAEKGDRLIILGYALVDEQEINKVRVKKLFVDKKNRPVKLTEDNHGLYHR
ncbi:MAG: aspartate 1-decarboxylase [Candidatus Omnitrophica bacterium]|nr:aspartate 1-decarboxylase [Candidatus Omnitrophota bacterium]MCM8794033.1 aspartate 1-decarboxylase [Candidatus Omnitrophota bacterium]